MSTSEKVRENRLRRMADRQGYRLAKSRRRDQLAADYGRWAIIDNDERTLVEGDLATVEAFLTEGRVI